MTEAGHTAVAEAIDLTQAERILVVDDRPEVLRVVDRTLGEHYRCQFASSVVEAREKLAGETFHLVLCDIQMPGESGLVLIEEITEQYPDTAVVLVTGVDDPDVAEKTFGLGAHGYLVKPFWPGQLLITTMNALRQRELEMARKAHNRTLEERMQLLMDMAPVPIYIKDTESRYMLANRVAQEVAGLAPGELIGKTDAAIMSPEATRYVRESDRRVLDGGRTYTSEETVEMGGQEKSFLTVKFPYVNDLGEVIGVSGISADITAQKEAERLQAELTVAQKQAIEDLRASQQETVDRLTRAIEMHDANTGEHVSRMAVIAAFLGEKMGLDREEVWLLRAAAPMHDVGKIATADQILRKTGPLTDEERLEMQRHTTIGHQILADSDSELLQMAATIALSHHERYDGSGYPRGLKDGDIPLVGRIVAVADVFDALLSDRSYRPAMSVDEATKLIEEGRGTHFDPQIADILLGHLDEALALRG